MRNPAHLGKVIATVDSIAGGRVIPGFGLGWMPREHTDFGMPFLPVGDRFDQLDETVQFLRQLWDPADGETSFDGRFVHADHVVCLPGPPRRPPILIGGAGERRTIPLAARHADIWNNPAISQHDLAHKIDVLRAEAVEADRDLSTLRISQQCLVVIGPDPASAQAQIDTAARVFGGHLGDPRGTLAIAGDPDRVVEQIRRHVDLGCTMLIVEFFGRDIREPARLFAETVLPQLATDSTALETTQRSARPHAMPFRTSCRNGGASHMPRNASGVAPSAVTVRSTNGWLLVLGEWQWPKAT